MKYEAYHIANGGLDLSEIVVAENGEELLVDGLNG